MTTCLICLFLENKNGFQVVVEFHDVILFHRFSHRQTEHLGKSFLSYDWNWINFANTKTENALTVSRENGVEGSQS